MFNADLVVEKMRAHLRDEKAKHQLACNRRQETVQEHHFHVAMRQAYENMETALADMIRRANVDADKEEDR